MLRVRCDHVLIMYVYLISLVSLITYTATYPSHRLTASTVVLFTPRWVDRLVAAAGIMDPHAPSERDGGGEKRRRKR